MFQDYILVPSSRNMLFKKKEYNLILGDRRDRLSLNVGFKPLLLPDNPEDGRTQTAAEV
jgi:hypothetical protein